MEHSHLLFMIAAILSAGAFSQWIAFKTGLPAIIFLLFSGIILGPVTGVVEPKVLLNDLFFPFISLSVAIILFEGSLTLKFRDILGLEQVVQNLVSFGMIITFLITTLAAKFAIGLSYEMSFLFAAITVVSGPTVVIPMLKSFRPTASISHILRWEGIVIDPIGATLAILVYEFIIAGGGGNALGHTLITFAKLIGTGVLMGIIGGFLFGTIIRKHLVPDFLQNVSALSFVLVSFILSNIIQPESGLVTVTVMGVYLANMKAVHLDEILDFKENITIFLISVLFIILAARIDLSALIGLGWRAMVLFIVVQFLARPLNVMASTVGSTLSWPEKHMLAWIAPRGIIAAAISALFAVQLESKGFADASLLVPLTFFIIISTVLFQSFTARPIARFLNVAEPEPKGFLIIGANILARRIAQVLVSCGVNVMVTDTGWSNASKAKIEGIPTYFGNPMSEHADRHLDMIGIGNVLALSPHDNVNITAAMHYQMEFGRNKVYSISSRPCEDIPERTRIPTHIKGKKLFGCDITFNDLFSSLSRGGEIRCTTLTEQFTIEDFIEEHQGRATPLFAKDEKGTIHVYCEEDTITPEAGWTVIYHIPS